MDRDREFAKRKDAERAVKQDCHINNAIYDNPVGAKINDDNKFAEAR